MSERFDDLARRLAAPMPRRRTFAVLAGALATIVLPGAVRRGRAAENLQRFDDSTDQYLLDFETIVTRREDAIADMHVRALGVPVRLGPGASFPVSKPLELLSFTGNDMGDCSYSPDVHVTRPFQVNSGKLVLSTVAGTTVVTDVELVIEPGDLAYTIIWHCPAEPPDDPPYDVTLPFQDSGLARWFNAYHQDEAGTGGIRIVGWDMIRGSIFAKKTYSRTMEDGLFTELTTFTLRGVGDCPPNQPSCGSACCPEGSDCCDPGRGLCCSASQQCCNPGPNGQCCGPETQCTPAAQFVPGSALSPYVCCPANRACRGECCPPGDVCVAEALCCSAAGVCGENSRACCDPGVCCGTGCCPSAELGFACCNGSCVDIWHDPNNCGACGHACPPQGNSPNPFFCGQGVCLERRGHGIGGMLTRN